MPKYADLFKGMGAVRQSPGSADDGQELETGPVRQENFTLLFVDDEENVLSALRRIFLEENYPF